jgi:hypothetical protein
MSETSFPQVQQARSFFEKTIKDNAAAWQTAVDVSVAVTRASLDYSAVVMEQWGKLATETPRPFTKTA